MFYLFYCLKSLVKEILQFKSYYLFDSFLTASTGMGDFSAFSWPLTIMIISTSCMAHPDDDAEKERSRLWAYIRRKKKTFPILFSSIIQLHFYDCITVCQSVWVCVCVGAWVCLCVCAEAMGLVHRIP